MTREEVVRIAREEVGETDAGVYWADVLPADWHEPYPPHWCGAFALWCLRTAGLTDWLWVDGVGFLSDGHHWRLDHTKSPQPGDIGYIDQPNQHYFVVERVEGDNVWSIDGNQGNRPGFVGERRRALNAATFFSIEKLLLPCEPAA